MKLISSLIALLLVSAAAVAAEPEAAKDVPLIPDECHEPKEPAKTLFDWAIGPEQDEEEEDEGEPPLATDRPDFTEASSTVGRGRIQLETGYTYTSDNNFGQRFRGHSYPEALFRIGMFADWFELRIEQNWANENDDVNDLDGNEDLSIGIKLALTEQKGCLPETALILQTSLPTGHDDFTNEELLPAFSYLYGWEIIPERLDTAGSTVIGRALDETGHFYVEMAQSWTFGYGLTEKLGAYTEWFAFFPTGSNDPDVGPEHYFNGGFTYLVTSNFQLDIRAGVGLNRHADNFFTGAGLSYRY